MHIINAKAVAFGEALKPEFKTYAAQVVANAKALAEALMNSGHHLLSNGTDNHLMLMDLRKFDAELTGKQAAIWLDNAGIIVNKNTVANDERSPFQTSGIRIGSPAVTTRNFAETCKIYYTRISGISAEKNLWLVLNRKFLYRIVINVAIIITRFIVDEWVMNWFEPFAGNRYRRAVG